ncbi:translation initiation factor IF-2 associated domain-containing protein, partial [Rhodoplanes elegans]
MTDTKNPGEKTLSVAQPKTLTLKRPGVEQGVVRQSFSHGRTKAVVVEKVKRRHGPEGKSEPTSPPPQQSSAPRPQPPRPQGGGGGGAPRPQQGGAGSRPQGGAGPRPQGGGGSRSSGVVLRTLTEEERS